MATRRDRQRVDAMIAAGVQPTKQSSEGLALVQGRSRVLVVANDGSRTRAGQYWEQATGNALPAGGFMEQVAQREGYREYIKLSYGKRGLVRRFDEASGDYEFTKLGKAYYKTIRRNYVAQVPVRVEGIRKDKSTYTYKSHTPIEKLGLKPKQLPLSLKMDERHAKVKELVRGELPASGILYEVSEERWTLDEGGSWRISEETVGVFPGSEDAGALLILDRRVAGKPLPPPTLLFPEHVCDEAYKEYEDKLCAPRQIAILLKTPLDVICD